MTGSRRRDRPPPPTPAAGAEEAGLLIAIAAGDRAAFTRLYDHYARPCYSLARRITLDPTLAEDAVQEAFLAIWRHAGAYTPGRGNPGTWVVSLTHHKAVDLIRREQTATDRQARAQNLARWASTAAEPDEQVTRIERADRVITAVAALTPVQREVLVLAFYGGYTYPDIATITGTPLGTVKTRAATALHRLRADLTDD